MSVTNVSYLRGLSLPTAGFLSQITDLTAANNHALLMGMSAGYPEPLFASVRGAKPDIQFSTSQLATLLAALGTDGLDTSDGNTDLLYCAAKNLGSRQADDATVHFRIRATSGLLYWTSIKGNYLADATASVRYKPVMDDDGNAPFVPTGSIALTELPKAIEYFKFGGFYAGASLDDAVQIEGVEGFSLDQNLQMEEIGADDDLYDTFCGIRERAPTLTLDGLDLATWLDYGLDGDQIAYWGLYLRKKSADTDDVDVGTAEHIYISGDDALILTPDTKGGGLNRTSTSIKLALTGGTGEDAMTAAFEINTASPIPYVSS
jgi:hypothetical protein